MSFLPDNFNQKQIPRAFYFTVKYFFIQLLYEVRSNLYDKLKSDFELYKMSKNNKVLSKFGISVNEKFAKQLKNFKNVNGIDYNCIIVELKSRKSTFVQTKKNKVLIPSLKILPYSSSVRKNDIFDQNVDMSQASSNQNSVSKEKKTNPNTTNESPKLRKLK